MKTINHKTIISSNIGTKEWQKEVLRALADKDSNFRITLSPKIHDLLGEYDREDKLMNNAKRFLLGLESEPYNTKITFKN